MESHVKFITPDLAKEMLKKNTRNVPINQKLVRFYADLMIRGQWVLTPEGISVSTDGILINGQHRLLAVIMANIPIQFNVHSDCDYDKLFPVTDTHRKRTGGNVLGADNVLNNNNIAAAIQRYAAFCKDIFISRNSRENFVSIKDIQNTYYERPDFWQHLFSASGKWYRETRILPTSLTCAISAYLILQKNTAK